MRLAPITSVLAWTVLTALAVLVPALLAPPARADFVPDRPFLYLNDADIQRMRQNVATYPWAQTLFNEAKSLSDANPTGRLLLGQGNTRGTTVGRWMMAHALCYQITQQQVYADRAASWLKIYANNNIEHGDFNSSPTTGARDNLGSWWSIYPVVYDLVYDGMSATDRALVADWLATDWYGPLQLDGFKSNHAFGKATSKLVTAYALGHTAKINECVASFKTHQNTWAGGYFWDASTQGWKNYYFTLDSAMLCAIVTHYAAQAGYAPHDLLMDQPTNTAVSLGKNLKDGNFKTMVDFCTPLGQVPYQSMSNGEMFLSYAGSYALQALDILAQRENWPEKELYAWHVKKSPNKKVHAIDWQMFDYFPGLTWGRDIPTTPHAANESTDHAGRGFAVLKSGDPAGPMSDNTLHAFLMHGVYGNVEGLNLKLYGKGKKLTQERMWYVNSDGLGSGGIFVISPKPAYTTEISKSMITGAERLLWDTEKGDFKVMTYDYRGAGRTTPGSHVRTVGVTPEYFLDIYRCNDGQSDYVYHCDAVGNTATASVTLGSAFTGNFWVNWANHMRYWAIAENTSWINISTYTDVAVKTVNGTPNQYPSDNINQLRIYRKNVNGPQDFIGIYEPIGQGGITRLTAVTRFNTTDLANITGVKVDGQDYADRVFYMHNPGTRTITNGAESIRGNGRYGYIRYRKGTRAVLVQGNVTACTVYAPNATSLTVNGVARTFTQTGDHIVWDSDAVSPGTIQLSAASYAVPEGAGGLAITVTRSGGNSGAASVQYAVTAGTAGAGDFTSATGTLNWASGEAGNKTFHLAVTEDGLVEPDETVNITLSGAVGAGLGTPSTALLTIQDDDAPGGLAFTASSLQLAESAGQLVVSVTRGGGSAGAASVRYAAVNGTAETPSDYTTAGGTLHWAAGEMGAKSFTVNIVDDEEIEGDETFALTLSEATGAGLSSPAQVEVTITDDDFAGQIGFTTANVALAESSLRATLTIARSGGRAGAASVRYAVTGGDASPGLDYQSIAGTLHWAAGEEGAKNIELPIYNDLEPEQDETIQLTLSDLSGATPGTLAVVVTVSDDDVYSGDPLQLNIADAFNMDAICGPKEYQRARAVGMDLQEMLGSLPNGQGWFALDQSWLPLIVSTQVGLEYSLPTDWYHPRRMTDAEALAETGVVQGTLFEYHMASLAGNITMPGDFTESADGSQLKPNSVYVGCQHTVSTFQIAEVVVELPAEQKRRYSDINFLLAASNQSDKARNMRIVALYGPEGQEEQVLYSFSTAEGGSGPRMLDSSPVADFAVVRTMTKGYDNNNTTAGAPSAKTGRLFEFASPLALDPERVLWGFLVEDVNPTLNFNSRGLFVFAATATPAGNEGKFVTATVAGSVPIPVLTWESIAGVPYAVFRSSNLDHWRQVHQITGTGETMAYYDDEVMPTGYYKVMELD